MYAIQNVALAGAGGSLGVVALKTLLDAGFHVTVLTRPNSSSTYPPEATVVKVSYDDAEALAAALKGQDAIVSAVGYTAFLEQKKLIDAAITSGVKRFIPSEFGADPDTPARHLPVFGHKVEVDKYLRERAQGTSLTYTFICNDEYLDWDLDNSFGVNIKERTMEIFDGGDVPYTATPLDFVANGIVKVLQQPDQTENRIIRLHGAKMTQNKLLALLQKYTGEDGWKISHVSTEDREKEGYQALQSDPSNFMAWGIPFIQISVWGERFGGDFSKRNDNEMLGLKELSEEEVEEIVRSRV